MLAIVAAIIFVITFLLNATSTATSAVFSATSLLLIRFACLALQIAGVGTGWSAQPTAAPMMPLEPGAAAYAIRQHATTDRGNSMVVGPGRLS